MYEVYLERAAERDLRRLPTNDFQRVIPLLQALTKEPRPIGARKITGSRNDWRIRSGDYRILYEIQERGKIVRVMRIRHRREAYR